MLTGRKEGDGQDEVRDVKGENMQPVLEELLSLHVCSRQRPTLCPSAHPLLIHF